MMKIKKTIVLFCMSFFLCGCAATLNLNQDVLAKSRIKKKSHIKKVMRDIEKSLPNAKRECPLIIKNITIFWPGDERYTASGEEWKIDVCDEARLYFVENWSPKRVAYKAVPKEKRVAFEKNSIEKWIHFANDKEFMKGIYYSDEILNDDEIKKWLEEYNNSEVKRIEYKIGNQVHEKYIRVPKNNRQE